MKTCTKCKKRKPFKDFHRDYRKKGGYKSACKACNAEVRAANHPGIPHPWSKKAQKENPKAYKWTWFVYRLKHEYNLTLERYEALWTAQGGHCAICDRLIRFGPAPNRRAAKKYAHIDHDPKTEKIRGLLCHNCNVGLGFLGDTLNHLKKAVTYLQTR